LSTLDNWIREELTVDVEKILSEYKEKVKNLISLTPSGEVLIRASGLTAKEKIMVYLIGKTYANIVGYSEATATNSEIKDTLSLREGTIRNCLFKLRNERLVTAVESGVHRIRIASIGMAFFSQFLRLNSSIIQSNRPTALFKYAYLGGRRNTRINTSFIMPLAIPRLTFRRSWVNA